MNSLSKNIALNAIGGFLTGFGLAGFLLSFPLRSHWWSVAPNAADLVHGIVYPVRSKGSGIVHYLSAFQMTALSLATFPALILGAVGGALTPRKNPQYRSGFGWAKVNYDADDRAGVVWRARIAGAIAMPVVAYSIGPAIVNLLNGAGAVLQW
jgi:hypothetical protein